MPFTWGKGSTEKFDILLVVAKQKEAESEPRPGVEQRFQRLGRLAE